MRVGEHALQEVLAHVVREADRLLLELRHRKSKAFLLARSPSSPLATLFLLFMLCLRLLLQICSKANVTCAALSTSAHLSAFSGEVRFAGTKCSSAATILFSPPAKD